ncbi:phage tail tip protein, partial [Escherichia coli]
YVRSVNLVGKSAFVEASGRASNDAAGYLELFREKIGKTHLAEALWAEIDNSQLKDEMAEMQTTITETRNEITQTVSKTLEDQSATIQQIQRVQTDTRNDLNSMWAVKLQKMQDGRLYIAGIGAGIENTDEGVQSQILLAADRVAFINPENGDTTPALVTQGGQTFINEALIKVLTAPTITSGGNPPAFSLTPDGRLTARNADISGNISASSGTLNNVTIAEDCTINGTMSADRIIGDIVKGYTVDMGQGVMTQNQLTFQKMILLKDNMPFDRKLMLMAYSFSRGEFIMKINDKVVVHARSGKVKTGEREVQISKNASRYEPVYSDVGGSASGSWGIPAGQGDARVEITFRYEAGVLFYRGGSILHDTSQIRIPDPVLFYLKSYTDDFDTAS